MKRVNERKKQKGDRINKIPSNGSQEDIGTGHPGGRPTKRTPEITSQIAEAISYGLTDEDAAQLVGIDDFTLTRWRKIPEFCGAIQKATSTRMLARLKRIEAGESGWQGTAWALERQYPERFARPEVQLSQKVYLTPQENNLLIWTQPHAALQAPKGNDASLSMEIGNLELVCDAETFTEAAE